MQYLVKNKYTYERRRQTDYREEPDRKEPSQNRITERMRMRKGERILEIAALGDGQNFKKSVSLDFSHSSGFMLNTRSASDAVVRIVFRDEDGRSFQTTACLHEEENHQLFSCAELDFSPVSVEIFCAGGPLERLSLDYIYVLNPLGEYGGQKFFYRGEALELEEEKGVLSLTLTDAEGSLFSPEFPDSPDTVYNMLMPQRNTVFMVLENPGDALEAELCYTTYEIPEPVSGASCTQRIAPGLHAVYFNLSDTPCCRGRLRSFRLILRGKPGARVFLHRYSFEQERVIAPSAGEILSCRATEDWVSVHGKIKPEYLSRFEGGVIRIYAVTPADDTDQPHGKRLLWEHPVEAEFACTDIPMRDECTTLLPYQLIAFLEKDGQAVRIGERFTIENYEDFTANPYAFSLPALSVSVLNYGAYGDAFHDDTDAIQRAIDFVSAQGGGTVVLPGGDPFYGRRYLVTNLLLRSMVELRVEKDAVLWQSPIKAHYPYAVSRGHDGVIEGVNWTHSMHVSNLPLIQCANAHHIKITGGGRLRSMDTGSEEGVDMPGYSSGCPDRIHVITLGLFDVDYIECRDVQIVRSNNYHTAFYHCAHVYCGNMMLHEVKCVSGDGFGLMGGTHDICVNRCFLQSNDDGIVMTAVYHDPRGILWWTNVKGEICAPYNIRVTHCYLNSGGGKALAFITWGTSDPIQARAEISGVVAYDNILTCVNPVGSWPDNPYNGKVPFDNSETDDYSPVRHVRIFRNRYEGNCTLGPVQPTDFLSDCGIHSTSDFRNGDFSLGGLANWTVWKNDAGDESVQTVIYADKEKGWIDRFDRGAVCAAQGLYLEEGHYRFTAEVMTGPSGAEIFVCRNLDGNPVLESETYACKKIYAASGPVRVCLEFTLRDDTAGELYLGFRSNGGDDRDFCMFDDCRCTASDSKEESERRRIESFWRQVQEDFCAEADVKPFSENGKCYLHVPAAADGLMLQTRRTLRQFSLSAAFRVEDYDRSRGQNGFGYRFAIRENGYRELRFNESAQTLTLCEVRDGKTTVLYSREHFFFTSTDFHIFALVVKDTCAEVWIDASCYGKIPCEAEEGSAAVMVWDAEVSVGNLTLRPDRDE